MADRDPRRRLALTSLAGLHRDARVLIRPPCRIDCVGCTRGVCLSDPSQYNAICTDVCTTDVDCRTGERCMTIGPAPTGGTRHCLSNDNAGPRCGHILCSAIYYSRCSDANTIEKTDSAGGLCTISYTHCPNGCEMVDGDGGGRHAECR